MEDQDKTKAELISELVALRKHVDEKNKLQTELGGLEQSLKVSEEKYKTLYENTPLSYQSLDVDGNFIDINPAWLRTLGYNREEVIGKNYADFLHPDWKEHFEKNFPEFKRVGHVHNVQFKIRHKDGHYLDISFEGCIGYYPDGKVKQTYCVFQDITDRKKVEQDLKESKLKYKLLAEFTYDWEYWIDPAGKYIYISPSVERITGYIVDEFYQNPEILFNMIREDYRDEISGHYKNENNIDEPVFKTVFPIISKSGKEVWISHTCSPVFDDSGTWIGRRGNNRDITNRIIAEKKLRKSEYLLNETQKISKIGGWEYRVSEEQAIWTDEVFNIFSLPKGKVPSHAERMKFYHKDDVPAITRAFQKCIAEGTAYELELPFTNAKKKKMWVSVSGRAVYKNNKIFKAIGNITDITEKKILELSLESEKVNAQTYLDIAGSILVALDKNGSIILLNKKGYETLGYKGENLLGSNWFDLVIPENIRSKVKGVFEKIMIGEMENVEYFENQVLTKSGELREIAWHNTNVLDNERNIVSVLSAGEDITERKKTAIDLEENEKKYRQLFELAQEGIWVIDADSKTTLVNFSMADILGYSVDEMIGIPIFNFMDETGIAIAEENVKRRKEGIKEQHDFEFIKKDGMRIIASMETAPIVDKDGNYKGAIAGVIDITKRKLTEEALKASEDRLSKIIFAANDGTWDWNLITNEVYFDPRYFEMAGYDVDEFPHKFEEFQKRIHPDDTEYVIGEAQKHLEGKLERFSVEFRFLKKDNSWLWVLGRGSIVEKDEQETPLRFVGTHTDITERKLAAEQVKESEANLTSLIENRDDSIWSVDDNLCYLTFNSFFAKAYLMAYGIELHKGDKVIDLLSPELQDFWKSKYETVLAGKDIEFEFSNNFEGKDFYYQVSLNPIISDKKVTGVSAISIEITDRKQAEVELKKRNKELEIFNDVTVNREFRIIELKKEINELIERTGEKPKYEIPV